MKAVATFPAAICAAPSFDARSIGETVAGQVYEYDAATVRFVERARWYQLAEGGWVAAQVGRVVRLRNVKE